VSCPCSGWAAEKAAEKVAEKVSEEFVEGRVGWLTEGKAFPA
jgi:hypothetical protein